MEVVQRTDVVDAKRCGDQTGCPWVIRNLASMDKVLRRRFEQFEAVDSETGSPYPMQLAQHQLPLVAQSTWNAQSGGGWTTSASFASSSSRPISLLRGRHPKDTIAVGTRYRSPGASSKFQYHSEKASQPLDHVQQPCTSSKGIRITARKPAALRHKYALDIAPKHQLGSQWSEKYLLIMEYLHDQGLLVSPPAAPIPTVPANLSQ